MPPLMYSFSVKISILPRGNCNVEVRRRCRRLFNHLKSIFLSLCVSISISFSAPLKNLLASSCLSLLFSSLSLSLSRSSLSTKGVERSCKPGFRPWKNFQVLLIESAQEANNWLKLTNQRQPDLSFTLNHLHSDPFDLPAYSVSLPTTKNIGKEGHQQCCSRQSSGLGREERIKLDWFCLFWNGYRVLLISKNSKDFNAPSWAFAFSFWVVVVGFV